ncbi:DUF4190 domain-containing protein [Chryseoglobus sp. 28M-23]|uniref:DUF4190 domain-containing protein n=1 Tax=Chryseoglobus sp. 28M-23 TaxID=2772253 RepID=UPI001745C5F1|nr:DUF4190 domain-containing protein [Chryseoglobus sp. 28M-23]QOD93473.1 DUF4190 domain-containing protein [Chryseoglobus sp. 28M-23]
MTTPQPPVMYVQRAPSNGLAVAGLVLGIVGLITALIPFIGWFLAFLPALLAVIFGHIGFGTAKRTGLRKGESVASFVLGYLALVGTPIFTGILLLFGTAVSSTTEQVESQPEASESVEVAPPTYECLEVTEATVAGVQWGVDDRQDGLTVERAIAIVNPAEGTDSWFVAGLITGPGFGEGQVGVWNTLQDPTTAEGDSIAFVSVDGLAAEFSSYAQPNGFSAAIDGVTEVRDCLDQ